MEQEEYFNCVCQICEKKFHVKPYHKNKYKTHYCSKACQNEARKIYMRGEGNHQYGLLGSKNPTWNGGEMHSNGYKYIQAIGHPFSKGRTQYVYEHRLVAEKYLLTDENSIEIDGKRYLSPDYVVHHKNMNRLDNRPENLEIIPLSEHTSLHNHLVIMERDDKGRFVKGKRVVLNGGEA